jgi:enoyl-CoA hydratase/carnithine racemase
MSETIDHFETINHFEAINYSVEDGVAFIQLNRPQQHNAVNSVMNRELPLVWQKFNNDPNAIVAIFSGAGAKTFCSGADIADLPLPGDQDLTADSIRWTARQNAVWKPVICAVNGMAIGGGLHFIADSDIVIAADTATFFDTHVRVGLVAGLEPVSLCRRMPMEAVLRMALIGGGERISAQRAYEVGLVGEIVAAEQLLIRAREIADLLKRNSPAAMARTKQAIWQAQEMSLEAGLANAIHLINENNRGADFSEGIRAFIEKRPPRWQVFAPE